MSDADARLQPRRSGLTRRQKRALSRGAQYVVFVAAVIAFAVTADWRLKNQFAQWDLVKQMFPDVITLALKNTGALHDVRLRRRSALGLVIALMRLSPRWPDRWLAGIYIEIFRGLPALLIFVFVVFACALGVPGRRSPAVRTARWRSRSAWSRPRTWPRRSARASRRCPRDRWRRPVRWASRTRGPWSRSSSRRRSAS